MTHRDPVNSIQNVWFDAEQVDNDDLNVEQAYNNAIQSGLVNNHIGSGVLPETLNQRVLFDSLLTTGLLDGIGIPTQNQPSDTNFGNQLAVTLSGSIAAGKRTVKVAIIGLDFQGNLQYDRFTFKLNETQYTTKHYTNIATILFNDFVGETAQSFNLGGRVVISEATPYTLSRDAIMVSQDVEPNLFFRDFYTANNTATLEVMLQTALPLFNVDSLDITTGFKENQILVQGDVTTQIGQKFLATTNNIQKVSLLLSVQNTASGQATNLNWHGDLVISIYPLQSTVDCPTDIVPDLAIDFPPSNVPLAQVSINYNSLLAQGTLLDGNPQPVDFVFSNTQVATGNTITIGDYYVVTAKRSGSADQCDILLTAGSDRIPNSRVTVFTGSTWVDIQEDDLWFRVWTDATKVSDGQAYETGHGIIIPKTMQNSSTNITTDFALNAIPFSGGENLSAVLSSKVVQSEPVQDQRTGDNVDSRQQFAPDIRLLNSIDLKNLEAASEPLIIGTVIDKNQKFISSTPTILAALHAWTVIKNTIVIKIIDDVTDGYRYDPNVLALVSSLLNGDLTDAQIIPDTNKPSQFYRISSATLCNMIYGDVNGDGMVDENDFVLANELIGDNLNVSPPLNSQITTDGYHTTVVNGYEMLTNPFVAETGLTFQIVDPSTTAVLASGIDGAISINPNNPALAEFDSPSTNFSSISNISNMWLVIYGATQQADNGSFTIITVDVSSNHVLDIQKQYYTPDIIKQIFRADIDGDFQITSNDGYLIGNYVNKVPPFPNTSLPASKIGTQFSVITLTVDPFLYMDSTNSTDPDRNDDFPNTTANRNTTLHIVEDMFANDGYMQAHDYKDFPIQFNIVKQFVWEDYLIVSSADARFVPTVFTSINGLTINNCSLTGVNCETYATPATFDPGRVDVFVPNNLIIGTGGELMRPSGNFYKVDFETGTVTIEIPNTVLGTEQTINVFDYFVSDYSGTGITRLGYPAMRFADCSTVQPSAILNNQVRFSVAAQSFSPNLNGLTIDGYTGIIVDGRIGVFIDHSTGLLKLNFANLYQDPVLQTLNTKVQINVYLKKAGFNNTPLFIDSVAMGNLMALIGS